MVSKGSIISITHGEIVDLCERLGHDPARVARITIEPHVVVVEYEHPIMGPDPTEVQHPTVRPDAASST